MYKKIKNIFILVIFLSFTFLISKYYFSEQNVIITNKSRSSYEVSLMNNTNDLPILENDTNDIITYTDDLESLKKKKKKRFWEKLISSKDE